MDFMGYATRFVFFIMGISWWGFQFGGAENMFPNVPSPGERFWVPKFDQLTHPLDPVTNQSLGILILNRAVEQWNIIESISQKANWMLKKILIDLDLISFPDASMCFFDA